MNLYIVRHGPAEDMSPSGRDSDRALTAKGRARVSRVAQVLAQRQEIPGLIFTSPLVRAAQTAELIARGGQDPQPVQSTAQPHARPAATAVVAVRQEIAPGGNLLGLVEELLQTHVHPVMLVGHEPDLSDLTRGLLGTAWSEGFDKSMVVGLRVHNAKASELRFVLDPKDLVWRC